MTLKSLLLFGSLGLLAGGCADVSSNDIYFRELSPAYWEGSQIKPPSQMDLKHAPELDSVYIAATLANTARM